VRRRTFISLMLWAVTASLAAAGTPTNAFTISPPDKRDYLVARWAGPAVVPPPPEVDCDGRPTSARWYVEGTRIKSTVGGGYLAYDPTARDGRVFLVSSPGEDTDWDVNVPEKSRLAEGKRAVIRVAKGPLRGWYLSVKEETKREGERSVTIQRVWLTKDPGRKLEAERIILHK